MRSVPSRGRPRAAAVAHAFLALCAGALLVVVTAPGTRTLALDASPGATPEVRAAYDKVANEVLCHCGCARQTVKDCSCSVAFDLRTDWERRLSSGETPERLISEYIEDHGEQSRNAPPRKGLNLLAWFGPGIAILVAAGATVLVIGVWAARGRRARRGAPDPAAANPGGPQSGDAKLADARLRERLERDLKEFE